jgi:hypothetical protein
MAAWSDGTELKCMTGMAPDPDIGRWPGWSIW